MRSHFFTLPQGGRDLSWPFLDWIQLHHFSLWKTSFFLVRNVYGERKLLKASRWLHLFKVVEAALSSRNLTSRSAWWLGRRHTHDSCLVAGSAGVGIRSHLFPQLGAWWTHLSNLMTSHDLFIKWQRTLEFVSMTSLPIPKPCPLTVSGIISNK